MDTVNKAKEENKKELLEKKGVWGICIGNKITDGRDTGEKCVQVWVEEKKPLKDIRDEDLIPKTLMERNSAMLIKTDVMDNPMPEILTLKLEGKEIDRKARHRPINPGISVGHYGITAGTTSSPVVEIESNKLLSLSNSHVYCPSWGGAGIGDNLLQPGPHDGGKNPADKFAEVYDYYEIGFNGELNEMDAALGIPTREDDLNNNIVGVGEASGIETNLQMNDVIGKSGRTTSVTEGTLIGLDGTVKVSYGGGKVAVFDGQVFTTKIFEGGDSGSACYVKKNGSILICGLGFAGSTNMSIFTPIKPIMDYFKCRLYVRGGQEDKVKTINIALKKEANPNIKWSINGIVTDYETKNPLKLVDIKIGEKKTNTDNTGYFAIADMEEGEYTITAELEGYVTHTEDFKLGADVTRTRLD